MLCLLAINRLLRALRRSTSRLGETWYAWRMSRQMLACCKRLLATQPALNGRPLYAAVLAKQLGLESDRIAQVLAGAEDSFCKWPVERDLRFRDVVHYFVTEDYLRSYPASIGISINVGQLIARAIPKEL